MIGFSKRILLLVLTGFSWAVSFSQDRVKPKGMEELEVKIVGFENHKIEFKSFYYQDGPSVFLGAKQIAWVKYANGFFDSMALANDNFTLPGFSAPKPAPVVVADNSTTVKPVIAAPVEAPDADGDGVPDKDDKCPKVKGSPEHHGCPDSDGDGVFDDEDKCLTLKGPAEHHGCPDSDGDGVFDDEDKCLLIPGPVENHGCPLESDIDSTADADDDGIPDYADRCPYEKGVKMYDGCPTPKHLVAENHDATFADLEFAEKQSLLLLPAKMLLDQFIQSKTKELNGTSGYEWLIVLKAYADKNEGEVPAEKEELSKQRLMAVYNYIVSHGIPAEIIKSDYVGDAESLAPSDTEMHRKKNRVVELIQRFKK